MSKMLPVKVTMNAAGVIQDISVGGNSISGAIPNGQASFSARSTAHEQPVLDVLFTVDEVVIQDA